MQSPDSLLRVASNHLPRVASNHLIRTTSYSWFERRRLMVRAAGKAAAPAAEVTTSLGSFENKSERKPRLSVLSLRQIGFRRLYTLKGGAFYYLEKEGLTTRIGNLFVFDARLSLPPSTFKPGYDHANEIIELANKSKFARCYVCGSQVHDLRHRYCENIDCNLLFLSCTNCVEDMRECCCCLCTSTPWLRPLHGIHRYIKSGITTTTTTLKNPE